MSSADPFVLTLQRWIEVTMHRSIRNFLCYSRESGISMSQLGALVYVHRAGSSGVTDLGEHLGVTSAAASQMLDRLVKQELIQRSVDPNDRRVKQIVLTDKGLQVLRDSIRSGQGWMYDLAQALSTPEKEAITAALKLLIDKASHLGPSVKPDR